MELNFETPFSTKITTADDYYFDSDDPDNVYVSTVQKPKLVKKIKNSEKSDKKKKIKGKGDGPTVMKKKCKKKDKEETKGEQPPKKPPKMKLEALHHTLPINL